uniref:Uncharacterized protein n=1 Tax=Medicago truncatula TaxID=3880 RepID=I3SL76_MEDTR|nr:unknown [Medicago truncatula]
MYPNVTPDSPSNFCPQRIHISPNEPGCVHTSTFTDDSATTSLCSMIPSEVDPSVSSVLSNLRLLFLTSSNSSWVSASSSADESGELASRASLRYEMKSSLPEECAGESVTTLMYTWRLEFRRRR